MPKPTTTDLAERHCKACEGGAAKLDTTDINNLLAELEQSWQLCAEETTLKRKFEFRNYYQTTAFVNAVVWIAHSEDHHPDIEFAYNNVSILYQTHAVGGLTENDFICAAKIDRLLEHG